MIVYLTCFVCGAISVQFWPRPNGDTRGCSTASRMCTACSFIGTPLGPPDEPPVDTHIGYVEFSIRTGWGV